MTLADLPTAPRERILTRQLRFDLPGLGTRSFAFPTQFRDSRCAVAVFLCDRRAVERELPPSLRPLALTPATSVVVIAAYDHRDVSEMASYREASVLVPATLRERWVPPAVPLWLASPLRGFGHAPLVMPVDSALNEARGAIWGMPKYLADVHVDATAAGVVVSIAEGGRLALRFRIPGGGRRRHVNLRSRLWCKSGPTCVVQRGGCDVRSALQSGRGVVDAVTFGADTRVGALLKRIRARRWAVESRVFDHLCMTLDLPAGPVGAPS